MSLPTPLLALAAWLIATTTPAWAAPAEQSPTPPTIVLETRVGDAGSGRAGAAVLDELERRGLAVRPASILTLLRGRAPQPGILDPELTTDSILALSRRGFDAFTRAEYKDAATTLALAVHRIKRNPGLLVLDAANARATFHAFLGLALSQAKLGYSADSFETMTELLRAFPTQTVSRADYGPQAEQFYRSVQKQTEAMGRGQLVITVDDPRAMIFVDSELRGTGKATLVALIPGDYRVFIHVPGSGNRQYQVEVRAGAQSQLGVDWQIDAALTVSPPWIGFAFATAADRDRASDYASALARRWGHDSIVVIDAAERPDARTVRGTLYRADGEVVRRATIVCDGDEARPRALARFIASGMGSPDLSEVTRPAAGSGEITSGTREHTLPAWPFLAGGAAAIAVGITLIAIDQDYGHTDAHGVRTPYYWDTAPAGIAVGLTGAASTAFGLWWWTRHRSSSRVPSLSAGRDHVVLSWSAAF